jgi:Fe-S oxidoreductase
MDRFRRTARRLEALLDPLLEAGVPVVGIEPSIVLCLRQEYPQELSRTATGHVRMIQEWLERDGLAALQRLRPSTGARGYRLAAHCTEKSAVPQAGAQWRRVFEAAGSSLEEVAVGCCGMAGTYGHQSEHQQNSRRLYELSWRAAVEQAGDHFLATGFSCRRQVERQGAQRPLHPIQALEAHFGIFSAEPTDRIS